MWCGVGGVGGRGGGGPWRGGYGANSTAVQRKEGEFIESN